VSPANAAVEFEKSRRSFAVGLKALSAAPSTTQAIRDELERARQHWMQYEQALDAREGDRKSRAAAVATGSERLLDAMDVITGMFEKLGG
jgi:hypothetical protein